MMRKRTRATHLLPLHPHPPSAGANSTMRKRTPTYAYPALTCSPATTHADSVDRY